MKFKPKEFTVDIPESRTAQYPNENRDESKLLVFQKSTGKIIHVGHFKDILEFIAGDTIIFNNTKVIPAMVEGRKSTGGKISALLMPDPELLMSTELGDADDSFILQSLINPGRRLKPGVRISFSNNCEYILIEKSRSGVWTGRFQGIPQSQFGEWLDKAGTIPLPPYIHREAVGSDRQRYQTVYAENIGSLAAPTAGFHFTKRLLDELESAGSVLRHLALNIGLGTFEPLRSADFTDFKIHSESFYIPTETAAAINSCTEDDSPVTLVGTTVLRTLESAVDGKRKLTAGGGIAGIFISPPYEFKVSNRLLTNFHRPGSTIIQLVAALIGWDSLNLCYHTALAEDFGFYSYGDAMLVI